MLSCNSHGGMKRLCPGLDACANRVDCVPMPHIRSLGNSTLFLIIIGAL
jgi:hypothetical protein